MNIKDSNIAIVHDWFLKKSFGGSEKVTLIINDLLNEKYSNPDIFSLTSNLDNLKIRAMYTPGHTSDSYCFLMDNQLFSGDTLLINGTGRTDFQNGSATAAYNSIFNKLLKLPEDTLLYPAHDYKGEKVSTIGKEKKQNPRLQVNSVDEYVEIMNNLNLKKPKEIDFNVAKNINLGA